MFNFKNAKLIEKNICAKYQIEDAIFYLEPNFEAQLNGMINQFKENEDVILEEIENTVIKNKRVIFTADFENPVLYDDSYIYRELTDITNKLNIIYDNKGNPDSDYGD